MIINIYEKGKSSIVSAEDFKRAIGVQYEIFDIMLEESRKNIRDFGRLSELSRTDKRLVTIMYWREYQAEFYIGIFYGISEPPVCS